MNRAKKPKWLFNLSKLLKYIYIAALLEPSFHQSQSYLAGRPSEIFSIFKMGSVSSKRLKGQAQDEDHIYICDRLIG